MTHLIENDTDKKNQDSAPFQRLYLLPAAHSWDAGDRPALGLTLMAVDFKGLCIC